MTRSLNQLINPSSWSIRWRLTLWYTACVLSILTMAGIVAIYGFRAAIVADTDRSLTIKAAAIIAKITGGDRIRFQRTYYVPPLNPVEMAQRAQIAVSEQDFDSSGDPIYTRLIDTVGDRAVASSSNIMRRGFVEQRLGSVSSITRLGVHAFFVGSDKENELRVLLVRVPRSPFTLQLATPWSRNEDVLTQVTGPMIWIVLFFVAVSSLGGWLLVGRTLQPISEIVSEAEKLRGDRLEPAFVAARTYGKDEIGHLVSALNAMMSRVHGAVAMQRQFTADASHDLRTPLTILRGEMEFALAKRRTSEEYRDALKNGLDAADRLIRIVADLSELAMADSQEVGQSLSNQTAVDVCDLCESVLTSRMSEASARNISLSFRDSSGAESTFASVNRLAMERAIANLIDNAIIYNRSGGSVEVVTGLSHDNRVTIDVIDTGIGIHEADQTHIFDRFYRGDKARGSSGNDEHGSGSGLGLAIAQYVVTSCGGELNVTSKVGHGSRFTISLPRLEGASAAPETQAPPAFAA